MLILLLVSLVTGASAAASNALLALHNLSRRIATEQVLHDTESWPPMIPHLLRQPLDGSYKRRAGLFSSFVTFNLFGNEALKVARNRIGIYDSNAFVTEFALNALLEADQVVAAHQAGERLVEEWRLVNASTALLDDFPDARHASTSLAFNFWPRPRGDDPESQPVGPDNFGLLLGLVGSASALVRAALRSAGVTQLPPFFDSALSFANDAQREMTIPADADCGSNALVVGSRIKARQEDFPHLWASWSSRVGDSDALGMLKLIDRYAHRPRSSDPGKSTIDARSYFWMHPFLVNQSVLNATDEPAYVTTWFLRSNTPTQKLPVNLNTVDVCVSANSLLAMTTAAADGLIFQAPGDPFEAVFAGTSRLLAWVVQQRLVPHRPDLLCPFYPSPYVFYWFLGRVVFALENVLDRRSNPRSAAVVLQQAHRLLSEAMRGSLLSTLMSMPGRSWDNETAANVWDGFIGRADDHDNHDDRLYATGVVSNALIDSFTYTPEGSTPGTRMWLASTPSDVRYAFDGTARFLTHHALLQHNQLPLENAFFAGDFNFIGRLPTANMPWYYPTNVLHFANGTAVRCNDKKTFQGEIAAHEAARGLIAAVRGVMNEDEFSEKMRAGCLGASVPQFPGFNSAPEYLANAYWSAPTITYSVMMGAIAKALAVSS